MRHCLETMRTTVSMRHARSDLEHDTTDQQDSTRFRPHTKLQPQPPTHFRIGKEHPDR